MDTLELPIVYKHRPATALRPRRYRWAPQDRPPTGGRIFVGLLGGAAMLVTAALLLSDRAPGILRSLFGERAHQLWARIDAGGRVDVSAGSAAAEITQPDFVVHVALWTIVAVLIGIAIWTWRGLIVAGTALAACSVALELAQGRYASTRAVEASDAAANMAGIALGLSLAGCCYLGWSGIARVVTPRPARSRPATPQRT